MNRELGVIENDVLIGRNGELYLARGGHHIFDIVTGDRKVAPEILAAFQENIGQRRNYAKENNVRYKHVIFPDKQSVTYKNYIISNPICLGTVYLEKSPDIAQDIFYPLEILRGEDQSSYLKTDTHMTDWGMILVVCKLVEMLTGETQQIRREYLLQTLKAKRVHTGDLGSKLRPPESNEEVFSTLGWKQIWLHNKINGGNNGLVDLYFSPDASYDQRILWFGDSFGREAVKFLSLFFREIIFLRTPFFHKELFDAVRPDILITENVERYLASCQYDEIRPSFFMYPYMSGVAYEPNIEFANAFSAVLSFPRAPYAALVKKIFG
jgi:hypothetical protein